jgi:hypothetical protein
VSAENEKKTADANNDLDSKQFYKGQLREWLKIRSYLTKNLNPKLPGRIRKALEAKN